MMNVSTDNENEKSLHEMLVCSTAPARCGLRARLGTSPSALEHSSRLLIIVTQATRPSADIKESFNYYPINGHLVFRITVW